MKTRLFITILVGVVLLCLSLALNVHAYVYNGLNKGVAIEVAGQTYGLEIVGEPGFFEGNY